MLKIFVSLALLLGLTVGLGACGGEGGGGGTSPTPPAKSP